MTRCAALLLVLLTTACRTAQPAGPPPATTSTSRPSPSAALPDSIRWVEQSAEYVAAVEQAYRTATQAVEAAARGRQPASWAVILDADETVISNATYQEERARAGLPYSTESWHAWVERRAATPLPGAREFLARVRALGGRIAIVTNRLGSECAATEAVFAAHALVYDAMLCRPDGSPSDKNPRFADVAAGRTRAGDVPLEVVAFLGDNIQDFPGQSQAVRSQGRDAFQNFGVRWFLLPNPMYGSWQ